VELVTNYILEIKICHVGSHSVTCHLTAVTCLNPQPNRLVCNLPTPDWWKAELA